MEKKSNNKLSRETFHIENNRGYNLTILPTIKQQKVKSCSFLSQRVVGSVSFSGSWWLVYTQKIQPSSDKSQSRTCPVHVNSLISNNDEIQCDRNLCEGSVVFWKRYLTGRKACNYFCIPCCSVDGLLWAEYKQNKANYKQNLKWKETTEVKHKCNMITR